jgi:hypothetical protein
VTRPSGPEGELDRALLFYRARAALEQGEEGRRWVVMVDDIDHLDDLSRALLVSLVHARTAFIVCTIRSTGHNDDEVRTLVNDSHLRRIEPTPLAADTVEALLHRVFGAPIAEDSLEQLVDAATGNPGVLRQLVESARDAGNLVERDGMWHLTQPLVHASPTLELLVEERLAGLRDDERDVIELLAVAGELGLDLLEKIAGASVLEALERRGLLMVTKSAQRVEVSLSHPLFAEVINLQLPAVRGRRIRRTLAEALTADGARRRGDRVRVVAWSLEGGGKVDVCLLAEAARLALVEGDEAMAERILAQAPEGDRTLVFIHEQSKLGKVAVVTAQDVQQGSMLVTLEPLCEITGRLLDRQGKPVADARVDPQTKTPPNDQDLSATSTDADGRFHCLVPAGCNYWFAFAKDGSYETDFAQVEAPAGGTIDVGDVHVIGR